jgi:hypothetical protein
MQFFAKNAALIKQLIFFERFSKPKRKSEHK